MRGQMMLHILRGAKILEAAKVIFATRVNGFEMDRRIVARNNLAASENVDREIHRDCARMKEIKRPEIERAAG
jgi:hypothetical protein